MIWLIDGNNVMGSIPDGWWNDRPAAMERLAQRVARWCRTVEDDVVLDTAMEVARKLAAGSTTALRWMPGRSMTMAAMSSLRSLPRAIRPLLPAQ